MFKETIFQNIEIKCLEYNSFKEYIKDNTIDYNFRDLAEIYLDNSKVDIILKKFGNEIFNIVDNGTGVSNFIEMYMVNSYDDFNKLLIIEAIELLGDNNGKI
jgi:arsenate reductase-like glutaredoxin family protein